MQRLLFCSFTAASAQQFRSESTVKIAVKNAAHSNTQTVIPRIVIDTPITNEEEEDYEYSATIDPVRRSLAFAANSTKEARRLGGVYGLCAMDVVVPDNGVLVCDPPNTLPQICTMACKQGYYSSGVHRDIACADAMCEANCNSEPYLCKGSEIKYGVRDCEVTQYTSCNTYTSGLCLETVTNQCAYSFYEETSRPCCNITAVSPPEGCWISGCSGSCDNPGVYHYYSSTCGDMCPPWRDPETPQFQCSACKVPQTFGDHVVVLSTNARTQEDIPSEIVVGCDVGYWGNTVRSYCMSTDGTFYPPVSDMSCMKCSEPPELEGELFERVVTEANTDGTIGSVEFRCLPGFIGESTVSSCNKDAGFWSFVTPPYCELASSPSVSPSASVVVSLNVCVSEEVETEAEPSVTPTPSSTSTESPSFSATTTPSPSKSPRPPKVKGSRAPTQPPKIRPN